MRFLRKKDKMDENRAAFVSKVNSLNHSVYCVYTICYVQP